MRRAIAVVRSVRMVVEMVRSDVSEAVVSNGTISSLGEDEEFFTRIPSP